MQIQDIIGPSTPAGAALFLEWQGYHLLSIPRRELTNGANALRLFGVGGKRQGEESFVDCALRESREEIGAVVGAILSAETTFWRCSDGSLQRINLKDPLKPRLIWEKRQHTLHGSMARSLQAYYLVAYNAELMAKPKPQGEIAALVYLHEIHLKQFRATKHITIEEFLVAGGHIDCQLDINLDPSTVLLPHGTVHLLIEQFALAEEQA